MPVKGNAILDYRSLNVTDIDVKDNYVNITGGISYEGYIITNVETKKVKDIIYINVYGGYGVDENSKKLTINEKFEGEEIRQVILKGGGLLSGKNSKVIWNINNGDGSR